MIRVGHARSRMIVWQEMMAVIVLLLCWTIENCCSLFGIVAPMTVAVADDIEVI